LPPHLLAETLAAARAIDDEGRRARALTALAPRLPLHLLAEALTAARAITTENDRARALVALAPRLPPEVQPAALVEALAAARAITAEWYHIPVFATLTREHHRARALAARAPQIAKHPALAQHFLPTLRSLARRPRKELLGDLTALAAWIGAIAAWRGQPALPVALAQAVVDVGRCWR
jgi:hypothetical protein